MNNRPLCVFFVANAHTLPGLITRTAWENEAAIKDNQGINHGINQSTGRRRKIKISGCSRNPTSGESQLSGKEPKRVPKRIRNVSSAISFADDRGRSPEIKSDDRNDSSIYQAAYYVTSCLLLHLRDLLDLLSCIIGLLIHFRTRGENRLSRVYPASLRILMIYLAHSKALSNETSSKRTQNSANSVSNEPSDIKDQSSMFFSLDQSIFCLNKVYSISARQLDRQSRSLARNYSKTQKSPD